MKYYLKFLEMGRRPSFGEKWASPLNWSEAIPGYVLSRKQDIHHWIAPTLWVIEAEGVVPDGNKVVAKRARLIRQVEEWNEKNQRLFAGDCAERVLRIVEKKYPKDWRFKAAMNTARRLANGQVAEKERKATLVNIKSKINTMTYSYPTIGGVSDFNRWYAQNAAYYAAKSLESALHQEAWIAAANAASYSLESATFHHHRQAARKADYRWQINHLLTHYLKLNPEEFA